MFLGKNHWMILAVLNLVCCAINLGIHDWYLAAFCGTVGLFSMRLHQVGS